MLQSNLLDCTVSFQLTTSHGTHEVVGVVRALYVADRLRAVVAANESGTLHDILACQCKAMNPNRLPSYSVWMYWPQERKINGIKAIRSVTNMGLKDAKDFIETNSNPCCLIKDLSQERAEEIRRQVNADSNSNLEFEVRKDT